MKTEPSFSFFKNATAKEHSGIITLSAAIAKIRDCEWWREVAKARKILATESTAAYKKQRALILPLFALSGEMPSKAAGRTLKSHSGLLQGDFDGKDHTGMTTDQMRKIVISSPYVVAAFVSPSESGIKAIIRITASIESHRFCFLAAELHFAELGLKIDPATKDEKRLCFVSCDPELWSRDWEETETLKPTETELFEHEENKIRKPGKHPTELPKNTKKRQKIKAIKSSDLEHPRSDCHIDGRDPIETQTLQITQTKGRKREGEPPRMADDVKAGKRALSKLKKDERLHKLYRQYIEQKYTARQGERNEQLVAMVTFLFRAVSEARVMSLVMFYYDINQDVFSDSREQHQEEAESHLRNTKRAWRKSLNEGERNWHDELAEDTNRDHENTFRICQDLAKEDGTFFLSCGQLGARIGIDNKQAQRILLRFGKHKILDVVEKGTQHRQIKSGDKTTFKAGTATVYRWLLRDNG